jgi:hypothetical protein
LHPFVVGDVHKVTSKNFQAEYEEEDKRIFLFQFSIKFFFFDVSSDDEFIFLQI